MVEYVDIVDEEDKVIGKSTRKEVDKNILRVRASKIFISDKDGKILIHRRADDPNRNYPGMWDIGAAETAKAGESYEVAAIRGLMEELRIVGISNLDIKFLFKYIFTGEKTKRNYKIFSITINQEISFDRKEISEVKWVTEEELIGLLDKQNFVPSAKPILEKYLKLKNEK